MRGYWRAPSRGTGELVLVLQLCVLATKKGRACYLSTSARPLPCIPSTCCHAPCPRRLVLVLDSPASGNWVERIKALPKAEQLQLSMYVRVCVCVCDAVAVWRVYVMGERVHDVPVGQGC